MNDYFSTILTQHTAEIKELSAMLNNVKVSQAGYMTDIKYIKQKNDEVSQKFDDKFHRLEAKIDSNYYDLQKQIEAISNSIRELNVVKANLEAKNKRLKVFFEFILKNPMLVGAFLALIIFILYEVGNYLYYVESPIQKNNTHSLLDHYVRSANK